MSLTPPNRSPRKETESESASPRTARASSNPVAPFQLHQRITPRVKATDASSSPPPSPTVKVAQQALREEAQTPPSSPARLRATSGPEAESFVVQVIRRNIQEYSQEPLSSRKLELRAVQYIFLAEAKKHDKAEVAACLKQAHDDLQLAFDSCQAGTGLAERSQFTALSKAYEQLQACSLKHLQKDDERAKEMQRQCQEKK